MSNRIRTARFSSPLIVVALAGLVWPAVDANADEPSDLQKFQGTWVCTRTLKDGQDVKTFVGVKAIIKDDELTWIFPKPDGTENVRKCRFNIDPRQSPKQLDWYYVETPDKPFRRIYRFEGDVMWMADNTDGKGHPESFEKAVWQFECKRLDY